MRPTGRRTNAAIVTALTLLALAHSAAVWPRYAVGSFDDDASYLLVAKALAAGHGLTHPLPVGAGGVALAGTYPPGYSALLAPLTFVAGGSLTPYRLLSVACLAALLPMTWVLLRRRGLGVAPAAAVLALLAGNPVLATYSVMVMAELPFLVVLVGLLLLADRWDRTGGRLDGLWVVLAAAGLVYLKQAGLGVVGGLLLWLLLRRHVRRALVAGAGVAALLLPVVLARLATSTPLAGARYSSDLAVSGGGLLHRLDSAVTAAREWVTVALPAGIAPWHWVGSPFAVPGAFDATGPVDVALQVLRWSVPVLVIVGMVVWGGRRRAHPEVPVVAVYVLQTLGFPFINERRSILVLPLLVAFGVIGAGWLAGRVAGRLRAIPLAALAGGLAVVLLSQLSRDYLYAAGVDSSRPGGSDYLGLLAGTGRPGDVVETDYVWTTALFTGKRTSGSASNFNPLLNLTLVPACDPAVLRAAVAADGASYLLAAAFGNAGYAGNCVLALVTGQPWAVRLLRTAADSAAVFELIGPGTGHPALADRVAGVDPAGADAAGAPTAVTVLPEASQGAGEDPGGYPSALSAGAASLTWTWGAAVPVSQLSVGAVEAPPGAVVQLELRGADGGWHAAGPAATEPFRGFTTYELLALPPGTVAGGARVVVTGAGPGTFRLAAHDLHVLG